MVASAHRDCATCLADSTGLQVPKPEDFHPNPHALGRKSMSWALEPTLPSCSSSPTTALSSPGRQTPGILAPAIVLSPANEKQANTIQPVPTSSCFQTEVTQKLPWGRAAAVPAAGEQMGASWPPAVPLPPASPPRCPQPGHAAHGSRQGLEERCGESKAVDLGWRTLPTSSPRIPRDSVCGARRLVPPAAM